MPTVISHPAAALAAFPWFRSLRGQRGVLAAGAFLSIVPDLDVIGLRFGIPYADLFGHRGISHSLPFALAVSGVAAVLAARRRARKFFGLWLFFGICLASHGLLDALTNGGHGIAFFAPFSAKRYFFPVQPIAVSPLSLDRFFSSRGLAVLHSELLWIWSPALVICALGMLRQWQSGRRRK